MKKILLISALTCGSAFAGGQEGTGSIPDETPSSLELGQYKMICINTQFNENTPESYCVIVKKTEQE